ncbi:MAG TPA: nuclear transport factor 2 family protein [Polyangiaceae bacterium]|jgi:ketosteroid isomerase-like protein|nr:nuclear transport factor 2 family protein [Polyangiaceae bacterium]
MIDRERAREEALVLEANQEFYRAFSRGDFAAMSELWAKAASVACLHPGARLLCGRHAVLSSFRELLAAAPAWKMVSRDARVHWLGQCAFVTCLEANGEQPAHLAATNIFVLEDGRWRMVHHHAGPLSVPEPRRPPSALVN